LKRWDTDLVENFSKISKKGTLPRPFHHRQVKSKMLVEVQEMHFDEFQAIDFAVLLVPICEQEEFLAIPQSHNASGMRSRCQIWTPSFSPFEMMV
jgi:hypothetical protein